MPIYEYRCKSCGHALDALQKLSDEPLRECPVCGKSALRRLISAPAFRLKGGGWYETDFKSDKEKKRNLADDGAGTKTAASKSTDAATKPADTPSKKATEKKSTSTPSSGSAVA
jgi:putative FmdB family regulatory protein